MRHEWKKTAVVKSGGVVEVVLPEIPAGETVEITVRKAGLRNGSKRVGFGADRDLIEIQADFDAPLDDFKDYM